MIAFFPEPYPDELLYSLFARYYVRSGYPIYRSAAEDLYRDVNISPDMEFINPLTSDALHHLTKYKDMQQRILNNTLFPYYSAFIPNDRQRELLTQIADNKKVRCDMLRRIGEKEAVKGLLFCPCCANEDRKRYGETYWHRTHQIPHLYICPIHHCRLKYALTLKKGGRTPALLTAQELITVTDEITFVDNKSLIRLAEYINEVFKTINDVNSPVPVHVFLDSMLAYTPYKSKRGAQRNITKLTEDFIRFYKELPENPVTEVWQMQKVFTGDKLNPYVICMIADFLQISPTALVHRKITPRSQKKEFDARIHALFTAGYNCRQIADKLGISYESVKKMKAGSYEKSRTKQKGKGGVKRTDWELRDKETLPLVKEAILAIKESDGDRPVRITLSAVEKHLRLPSKSLLKMPICKKEVEQYTETMEQYWTREILWALDDIRKNCEPVTWTGIRRRINITRADFDRCLPLLLRTGEAKLLEAMVAESKKE